MEVGVDAYVSVAEVTAYLTARGQQATWEAAEQTAQEAAIIEATSFLDAAFSWVGSIEDPEQTLGWPRTCARDREGRILSDIPTLVRQACSELANLALGGRLMPMSLGSSDAVLKSERIGDSEWQYDTTRYSTSYDYVRTLLRGIGKLSGGGASMVRLSRS